MTSGPSSGWAVIGGWDLSPVSNLLPPRRVCLLACRGTSYIFVRVS